MQRLAALVPCSAAAVPEAAKHPRPTLPRPPGCRRADAYQAPMPKLSAPSQEQFLCYAEYLAQEGHATLVAQAHAAVEAVLADVPLQQQMGAAQVERLLSEALERFAAASGGGQDGWAAFLLPSSVEVAARLQVGWLPARPSGTALCRVCRCSMQRLSVL